MTTNRRNRLRPIVEVAEDLEIARDILEPYGRDKAKVRPGSNGSSGRQPGQADSGLGDHAHAGRRGEDHDVDRPGPGPAADWQARGRGLAPAVDGSGLRPQGRGDRRRASKVEPSNTINLQFTGDFHAITAAHNLLAATIDNHIHFRDFNLDPTKVLWKRVAGHERPGLAAHRDRAGRARLRASPARAALTSPRPARSWPSSAWPIRRPTCGARLDRILVGFIPRATSPCWPKQIGVVGSMAAILNEALMPNLVQTTEVGAGVRARWTLREHRPRLQLGARHPDGPVAGRLRGDRGRFRV